MKTCKSLIMWALLMSIMHFAEADFTTKAIAPFPIYNQSDVSIKVKWAATDTAKSVESTDIPARSNSGLGLGVIRSKNDATYNLVTIIYTITNPNAGPDTVSIAFIPTAAPTAIYVYGNGAVKMSDLDLTVEDPASTTNPKAKMPYPSRYVAWWTGNITAKTTSNSGGYADANAAITADGNPTTKMPVSLYMAALDGRTLIAF